MTTEPVDYGCDWPIDEGCFEDDWEALDDEVKDRSIQFASQTLRRLTGYRVGGCPITVRPCKTSCRDLAVPSYYDMLRMGGGTGFWPHVNSEGFWVNSCGCVTDCACVALCEVDLPGPVGPIESVKIDGSVVDPGDYRVDGTSLVWVGALECPWPACQDMKADDSQPNTFSVTYLNGHPVDTLGAYAAGVLAMEFSKACRGAKCRLPASVTAVSRQGVSYQISAGTFPNGITGIREVDAYIGIWNPNALRQESQVWSPDIRTARVVG